MEKNLFQELDANSKEETIREMAIRSENMVYQKPLSEGEEEYHYREFGNTAVNKDKIEQELEDLKQAYKDRIAPLKEKMKEHMHAIRNKAIEIEGEVFCILDETSKMVGYYTPEGELISSRRALPEELSNLYVSRTMTGTND